MAARSPGAPGEGVLGQFVSLGTGEIAARAVAFLATLYLTRTLGPEGFGILAFATALCGYLALAVRAGFNDIGARDVARNPHRAAEIAAGATLVRLGIAALAMLVVALVAAVLPRPPVVRLVVLLTGLTFFTVSLDVGWVYKGLGQNVRVGAALVTGQVLYVAIVLLVVNDPDDVVRVPLAQVAGEAGAALLLMVPLFKHRVIPDLREGLTILRASAAVTLTRLLRTLIYTFDILLIGLWIGEHQVGLYAAAYRFCFLLLSIAAALHIAYLPAFARVDAVEARRDLSARSVELSAAVGFPLAVGAGVLAEPLLAATFGTGYADSSWPFRILLISIAFIFIHGTNHNLMLVLARTREETGVVAAAAITNVALNLYAIPRYGLVGAAVTTAVSEVIVLVLGLGVLSRAGAKVPLGPLLRPAGAAAAMGLTLTLLWNELSLIASIAAGGAIYIGALLVLRGIPADVRAAFGHKP